MFFLCTDLRGRTGSIHGTWINQPHKRQQNIIYYVTRKLWKRFITCHFPQNLTSAAQASQHPLKQTKCFLRGAVQRGGGGWAGIFSHLNCSISIFLYS